MGPVDWRRAPRSAFCALQAPKLVRRDKDIKSEGMDPIDTLPLPSRLDVEAPMIATARFAIGDVVRHRMFDIRGVIFDVDPVFANSDDWYDAIPEQIRPAKNQPFYHLLAENAESSYVAYVSQQNLLPDDSDEPIEHPAMAGLFNGYADGRYLLKREHRH